MDKITFCIPSKSNLRYLKTCITSIRNNAFRNDHDIFIFVDEDEDGTIDWLESVKTKFNLKFFINPKLGKELFGIGKAYDFCIEKSSTEIFMIFHADMMLGKDADLKAFNHLKEKTVICSTRIEPPIHPNGGEKILLDFGMWPEEFKGKEFNEFVLSKLSDDKVTEGIFAPWMMYKKDFLYLGGHDPILHSCREDSDVFNRMLLAGYKFIQPWNSLVYHLTGRGAGSFDGDKERHEKWKKDMNNSTKEFIRKWGHNVSHTPLMKPIVYPKYDIGIILKDPNLLSFLELWCSNIYVDATLDFISKYIDQEQPTTSFNLREKVRPILDFNQNSCNDIMIEISSLTQQDLNYLQSLPLIIAESGEIGSFELGNLKININKMSNYQNKLIKL
jgi:glycosyltransferase involved in cell wall biosynthesis